MSRNYRMTEILYVILDLNEYHLYVDNLSRGLSQNLETGRPKLAIVKFLGVQIFKGDHSISNIKMYEFTKISHNILIQCHGSYMEMKKIQLYV